MFPRRVSVNKISRDTRCLSPSFKGMHIHIFHSSRQDATVQSFRYTPVFISVSSQTEGMCIDTHLSESTKIHTCKTRQFPSTKTHAYDAGSAMRVRTEKCMFCYVCFSGGLKMLWVNSGGPSPRLSRSSYSGGDTRPQRTGPCPGRKGVVAEVTFKSEGWGQ
jgi:hypothetical protein